MASTVVPKLPNEGDHAMLLRGQGAATATNSLLIQVYINHRCKLQASDPLILKPWKSSLLTQVATRLDGHGEQGAGDVVRAVAELLHLTGGHLVGFLSTSFCPQFCHSGLCPDGGTW